MKLIKVTFKPQKKGTDKKITTIVNLLFITYFTYDKTPKYLRWYKVRDTDGYNVSGLISDR